ncbi:hypothetical protein EHLJMEHL_04919 [Vreelandella titanicae]
MQKLQEMDGKVIAAVRECAHSINSMKKFVAAMSELIEVTSQLPLTNFDYWECLIRSAYSEAISESATPPKWKIWSKSKVPLSWLDLISWDGYKRERTLRALSGALPNAFIFSLILRRLNDWVPQVREAAREKLPEIARVSNPQHVAEALCAALPHWGAWGRIEEADKNVLLGIIDEERIAESLRHKLISSTSGPMPSLFAQFGRTSILDGKVEKIASCAIQPSVRAKAYRSLFERRITWVEGWKFEWVDIRYCESQLAPIISERPLNVQTSLIELLQRSAEDRSSLVRRVSAEVLIRELEHLGVVGRELAERFASDKSPTVAERGVFAVKKLERMGHGMA